MSFRAAFIVALRFSGVPDGTILDALLAAEGNERARRAALRVAKLNPDSDADSRGPVESGSVAALPVATSSGGAVKGRARRGLMLAAGLRPAARAVGAVLIDHVDLDSGRCDPGVATIARIAGLTGRSVRRALADLDALGLIRRVLHGGKRHANAYLPDWEALNRLGAEPPFGPNMNKADSVAQPGLNRTGESANTVSRIIPTVPVERVVRAARKAEPDRRQGSLLLPIAGRTEVADSKAEERVWRAIQNRWGRSETALGIVLALPGATFEAAHQAERQRHGAGLNVIDKALRSTGPPTAAAG